LSQVEVTMSVDLFGLKSWEGAIVRLSRTADGARAECWSAETRSWKPFAGADIVLASPPATDAELRSVGLKVEDAGG
jgi:hypothetical protein